MSYLGDRALGATIDFKFTTSVNGVGTTLSGTPVVSIYVGGSTTEFTTGVTLTADYDSRTGLNDVSIVASTGNGFAAGNDYQAVITTGTVGGVSQVGDVVAEFSIGLANVSNLASQAITAAAGVTFPTSVASPTNITAGVITTVTTVTNQLTAAQVATGIWQDTTAGDFTTAGSIGKSLFTSGNVPGAASGLFIAGTNAATSITTALTANITGNVTGNLSGSVGSVTGAVGSVTGAVGSVTGAVGSVTGNVGGNVTGSVASVVARVTANSDQLAGSATAATNLSDNALATTTGVVDTGATTTSIPTSSLTPPGAVANQFGSNVQPRYLIFDKATTTAALRNQSTSVSASTNAANPTFTVNALTTAPVAGDTFRLL